ncbi:hypothetical protein VDGE_30310 [Verticillium dahliae]|uniref:Uncharacterized protein n=1 Tax=Verticillium dahliae TaxID=27337 RepID=A0A444RWL0_VERDA|nr:hypothetical protein VDGE_30310 [Verticillium dahliae]
MARFSNSFVHFRCHLSSLFSCRHLLQAFKPTPKPLSGRKSPPAGIPLPTGAYPQFGDHPDSKQDAACPCSVVCPRQPDLNTFIHSLCTFHTGTIVHSFQLSFSGPLLARTSATSVRSIATTVILGSNIIIPPRPNPQTAARLCYKPALLRN